jgi:transposase-like protein
MRRTYPKSKRDELIRAVTTRGEPVAAAAGRLGVVTSTAYNWVRASGRGSETLRRRLGEDRPAFARLVAAGTADAALVVRVGGTEIEVRRGFDAELLQAVVAALHGGAA